jgi:hypothetical protein
MLDFADETPEGLLEATYRRVAAAIPAVKPAEDKESEAQFLAEVKERKRLRKWKEGRSFREPLVSSLDSEERQVLSSHLADPQSYRQSVRLSAEKHLETIFEPWALVSASRTQTGKQGGKRWDYGTFAEAGEKAKHSERK